MRNSLIASAAGLALAVGLAGGTALGQDSRSGMRGPWHMWSDDGEMRGPGRMGPGMMAPGMGMMGQGMMPMMFVMMDTDEDGAISLEEMQAVHRRMFGLVDANKDGKITVDEMRGFMGGPEKDD